MYIDRTIRLAPALHAREPKKRHAGNASLRLLGHGFRAIGIGALLLFLLLPTLIVIPMSLSATAHLQFPPQGLTFGWYRAFLDDPAWMGATWFSLKIASATCLAATIVGTMTAMVLVRGDMPFKGAIQALSLAPMVVPHIVLGVALYLVFAPLSLTGSLTGFLIGHTVLALPFVVITVTAALQRLDPALELAGLNCGASRFRTFLHVTLPNIAPGMFSGAVFAFLASFDEATVAFFISDVAGTTVSRKMFEDIDFNLTPVIAAASTVTVVVSLALIGLAHFLSTPSRKTKPREE